MDSTIALLESLATFSEESQDYDEPVTTIMVLDGDAIIQGTLGTHCVGYGGNEEEVA